MSCEIIWGYELWLCISSSTCVSDFEQHSLTFSTQDGITTSWYKQDGSTTSLAQQYIRKKPVPNLADFEWSIWTADPQYATSNDPTEHCPDVRTPVGDPEEVIIGKFLWPQPTAVPLQAAVGAACWGRMGFVVLSAPPVGLGDQEGESFVGSGTFYRDNNSYHICWYSRIQMSHEC